MRDVKYVKTVFRELDPKNKMITSVLLDSFCPDMRDLFSSICRERVAADSLVIMLKEVKDVIQI